MKTFYYPTTSLNFSNIFSLESLSPENHYKYRGFGFNYFANLFPRIKDYIVLFDEMPEFEISYSEEEEQYKMVLELEINNLLIETNEKGIWLCPTTIQLNIFSLKKVYFFSENELKRIVAKSEAGKSIKTLPKYRFIFDSNSVHNLPSKPYNFNVSCPSNTINLSVEFGRDRMFNNVKGFVYGFLAGQITTKNPSEIKFFNSIQKIKNKYALLKNNIAHNLTDNTYSRKSYNNTYSTKNESKYLIEDLANSINECKNLYTQFVDTFTEIDFLQEYFNKFLVKGYKNSINNDFFDFLIFTAKKLNLSPTLEKKAFDWFIAEYPFNPYTLFQTITNVANQYSKENKFQREELDSQMLKATFNLQKIAEEKFATQKETVADFRFSDFFYNSTINPISFKIEKAGVDTKKFEIIINILITHSKKKNKVVNDADLLAIVEKIGNNTYKIGEGKSTSLYKYLNKETLEYKDPTSVIFKNLAAFIFCPNDLEKLQNYIQQKNIESSYLAYSFFAAFNGFASLSKNFTNTIFSSPKLQLEIDEFLKVTFNQINKENILFHFEASIDEEIIDDSKILPKIEIDKIHSKLLKNANKLKIKLTNEGTSNLGSAISDIEKMIDRLKMPLIGQNKFLYSKLSELLSTKYKVKGLGAKSLDKLINSIKDK